MKYIETLDTVVVGAGVVGLACARALAQAGREVVILEAEQAFGTVTSARNSEVIHAGLYYAPGSLKARLCVAGKETLYSYCEARGIAHQRCGKLVVATAPAQFHYLETLQRQARLNGVLDTTLLDAQALHAMEPALQAVAALHSPSTGIVDSHGLMLSLLADAEHHGATIAYKSPLEHLRVTADGFELDVGGAPTMHIRARQLVNAAGIDAPRLAAQTEGLSSVHIPSHRLCKGSYFSLAGRAPFTRLIYPVPADGGLGIHLTLDLGGQARFGPDAQWLDEANANHSGATLDYRVDPTRASDFETEIRRYWPALAPGALLPAYSGVRPKLSGPNQPAADFLLSGPRDHGIVGLMNLFGMESPGLTACMAIGRAVVQGLSSAD